MLIDMNMTMAYKCSSCGSFEFFSLSIFKMFQQKELCFACHCGKSHMIIYKDSINNLKIKIPCISCDELHVFNIGKKEMLYNELNTFYCPRTGMQQCYIGNDSSVRSEIDNLEKELDELISLFGYENYFKNTQVMFDALNKIHDIAEMGNLLCECGSTDIELAMLPDKIELICKKCSGVESVLAATNKNLKEISMKQQIFIPIGCASNLIFKK